MFSSLVFSFIRSNQPTSHKHKSPLAREKIKQAHNCCSQKA